MSLHKSIGPAARESTNRIRRYELIGLPAHEVYLLHQWVAYLHMGKSVVPVNFHAEIDRYEAREIVVPSIGEAIDRWAYAPLLDRSPNEARLVAGLCLGARKGFARELGFTFQQADDALRVYGRSTSDAHERALKNPPKLSFPKSYVVSGEYAKAHKVPKRGSREWMAMQVNA
jgi:hypothetical protein